MQPSFTNICCAVNTRLVFELTECALDTFAFFSLTSPDEFTDAALRRMFISSHQLILIQPRWDIWGPHSSSSLCCLLLWCSICTHSDDFWLCSCLHIRKVIRLVFCFKTCHKQLSSGPTRGGFSCSSHNRGFWAGHVFSLAGWWGGGVLTAGWIWSKIPILSLFTLHTRPIINGFCCLPHLPPPPSQREAAVHSATPSLVTLKICRTKYPVW